MRSLGVLCARGASKRLPRKHLRDLAGFPLVAWMCRAAVASGLTRVILSTEDEEIAAAGRFAGVDVPFLRPGHLAEDYAEDFDIVNHALEFCERDEGATYDAIVMMQPTTPFMLPQHVNACLEALARDPKLSCCFTAREVSEPPQWMLRRQPDGYAVELFEGLGSAAASHTQLLDKYWFPTGAAYAARTGPFREQRAIYCKPYTFAEMEDFRSIDIDTELDLIMAEAVAQKHALVPVQRQ